ncbi:hypothetical protein UFOVP154_25 [uncultured Caudovirales phage]|uniref:Scaffolding protein n=1 Tax=uncultured Caudovirales phage TaxID=2100421 RepID=A0A6J5KLK9_9CAUD|nr:hypothetical protein UFOVP8_10 [uncultured Caudovirales phage]CAB5170437.1 hypothetical protein UFOVP154_25 [uncultured Caudovirales phage]
MVQQVIDQSNINQFLETGKVDEFKAPGDKPVDQKAEPEKDEKAAKAAEVVEGVEGDDLELPEKARRAIGKKHRAMKEAQEAQADADAFAETQYRERLQADKRAADLEARLKALESKEAAPVEDKNEPKPEDFPDAVQFARALAKYESEKAVAADRKARADEAAQKERERMDSQRIARNKEFAKDHPDYEEVVAGLTDNDLIVPPHLTQYLMEADTAPALMYHFAKHPSDFERIAALSPIRSIAAIGKLEATLEATPKADTPEPVVDKKVTSKAPAPIAPLSGNVGTVHKELKDMNTRETIEYWEARKKATGERRQRH